MADHHDEGLDESIRLEAARIQNLDPTVQDAVIASLPPSEY